VNIAIHPAIDAALRASAALAISISGGKDGQAMLAALVSWWRQQGYLGALYAIHSDLGRTEWPETAAHVERLAREAGVPLVVVRREQGDLLARWQERMQALEGTGKPFWSSAANRYCTSDLKRGPINKHLRQHQLVISAEGIRAAESPARAKKPVVSIREAITSEKLIGLSVEDALAYRSFGQRLALTWNPILHWTADDVWQACGTSTADLAERRARYVAGDPTALDGWPAHPAYVYGNERLSCALCVLASDNDIRNGARHNPALYQELRRMEVASGATFRHRRSLADIVESSL
jgi:3'-phosphoadenosine 5'-phosphosulfate sulfotransferase (PAPS reductase)/FAD synthetase